MPQVTRRAFLKTSAVAGATVTLSSFLPRARGASAAAASGAPTVPPAPSWIDQPMRWAQLTLVEDDPAATTGEAAKGNAAGKFDVGFWLDYFARTKSDAVCLSGGGCVAYYPTQIPLHHRSAWLGDRDVLGELVTGCRKLGMIVVVRTDPHATYDDVEAAHPDWIHVTADGQRRRHWASPEMWVTCGLGPYNFDFMTEVKREIVARYRPDGVFINRWDGSGMCYCEHCRKNFRDATGHELPRAANNPQEPAQRAYLLWKQDRLFALWRHWDAAVRAIHPDSCVTPNAGGGATSALDMKRIGELAPTLMADHQARRGVMPPWGNGMRGKEFRATMGRKPIVGIFSVGLEEPYRWKDSVQSPAEIRLWAIDGIANGLRPWFTKFAGSIHDPRWLEPVEKLYQWCAAHERYLRNERPLSRVGLVYSQQSAWFVRGPGARQHLEDAAHGWYHALIEARIPFEMVHDRLLDAEHLAAFKTLVLPNITALSDAQCAQLREFVARGGGIVATHETSLHDEWGVKRKDFGLADLFGVSFAGRSEGPMRNAYLHLGHDAKNARNTALLRGLEDTPRIIHGVNRLEVAAREEFPAPPLTLVPSYPDLPMEKVFPRQPRTDIAQVFLRESGTGGRVVYFPWDLDRTFWEILDVDHGKLLRNAVAWATNEPPPVQVAGSGVLDVTLWQQKNSLTVHLVNLTNPMLMKGPIREAIPVGAQKIRLRIPLALRPRAARLLVAGTEAAFRFSGDWLETEVPAITEHEVLAIETSSA